MGGISDELKELLAKASADFEFRARQHVPILGEDGVRDV
jgi:hypothetical protein